MDLNNVIEVKQIREKIKDDKNLLEIFKQIILLANMQNRIVDDTPMQSMAIEVHSEPILSDHESDSDENE